MKPRHMKFEKYKDAKGEWRWRLHGKNGKILADSGEGYKNKRHVHTVIVKIMNDMSHAFIAVDPE